MKTKWMIIPAMALLMGCAREMDNNVTYIDGEFTLHATSGEEGTRTVLQQDGKVFWSPSDCITVFYGNIPGKFTSTNTEPAASAEFTGSMGSFAIDGETEFKAIYPHSDDLVMPTDDGVLSIGLPWKQTAVEGTFADDLFICVAKSKDTNLHFYNVCGGVKFSLARDDIKKVVFRGNGNETLAGRMFVDFTSEGIPQVLDFTGGHSSVTLTAPDGGTFKPGAFYYLVTAPQTLSQGYTMELWADELVETVSSESSVTVRRAAWGVLKELGTVSSAAPEAIDLGLPSGLKWASFNLGASSPEEYGDYFAWGETEPKERYIWDTYLWNEGSWMDMTKYCFDANFGHNGFTDGKYGLDLEDDAAYARLGGNWRMPSIAELNELLDVCSWELTTENGVYGSKVTGPSGKTIFLPAAGWQVDNRMNNAGSRVRFWTSSLTFNRPDLAFYLSAFSGNTSWEYGYRYNGLSIRPVYAEHPSVQSESISLDKTAIEIAVGESITLNASILPRNATFTGLYWLSENTGIATISQSGEVTGIETGTTTITVYSMDGGKTATCTVTVKEATPSLQVPDAIDLGLSVKWASFNLGASKPEEYGDYYAWGETEPYYSSLDPLVWKEGKSAGYAWESYKWCMGDQFSMTKYCTQSSCGNSGFTDNKTTLELTDDAAHVMLGDKWRMPTNEEQKELEENCTWEWTSVNGVNGCRVVGNNGSSIFLPAGGRRGTDRLTSVGYSGYYWSSSLYLKYPYSAYYLVLASDMVFPGSNEDRYCGFLVRPVYDD